MSTPRAIAAIALLTGLLGCDAACIDTAEGGLRRPGARGRRGMAACAAFVCGNGAIQGDEDCDDGDTTSGDGCSSVCIEELGWDCTGAPSTCTTICGDGLIRGSEECDDDDIDNGDGCSSTCTVESGFACAGEPSVCSADFVNMLSLRIDGSNEDGTGCDAAEFDGATSMTVYFWLRPEADAGFQSVLGKFNWATSSTFDIALLADNRLNFYISSTAASEADLVTSSVVLSDAAWVCYVGVFDGGETGNTNRARHYFNATLDGSATSAGTIPASLAASTSAVKIGNYNGGSSFYTGRIDEPAIWIGTAATQAQVDELCSGPPADAVDVESTTLGTPSLWYRVDGSTHPTLSNSGSILSCDITLANSEAGDFDATVP